MGCANIVVVTVDGVSTNICFSLLISKMVLPHRDQNSTHSVFAATYDHPQTDRTETYHATLHPGPPTLKMCKATFFVCSEHDNLRAYKIVRCQRGTEGTGLARSEVIRVDGLPRLRQQGSCPDVPGIDTKIEVVCSAAPASPGGTFPCPYSFDGKPDPCHR
ncbi:hypothetical protein F5B21DRAFT_469900 [Xylaria acuta]|nr:hypothetical protein F5B21DRAFT_469900 [Xylaria acuta]